MKPFMIRSICINDYIPTRLTVKKNAPAARLRELLYVDRTIRDDYNQAVHPMATMKDVAAKAGVSVFTVSSAINNSPKIRASTRDKVLKAVAKLNYVPNFAARSLRTQRSETIGLLFPLFSSNTSRAFFGSVAEGVHDVVRENGFHVILSDVSNSLEEEQREIENLKAKDVDGLIYAPVHCSKISLAKTSFPVVVVDRRLNGFEGDTVFNNNFESSVEAVEYLIRQGHRRIAYVGRRGVYSNHRERYLGYKRALLRNGLPFDPELVRQSATPGQRGVVLGYAACPELLARKVTAIFCNESYGTIGILKYAQEQSIAIPGDLAVVTYDDLEWAQIVSPPLTAVQQPAYEMGSLAARILLQRIEDPSLPVQKRVIASKLVIRGSA
jgi:LacI family transcriptional regulator, galactose operon repressor